jgi:pilus assembly protein FimV
MRGTRTVRTLLAAALLAGHINAAQALDIDRIKIRSRLGEPLRAEIPVAGTAEELQALQAQLAAPVTFARIGLPRPQGVVADLRFAVVRDGRGGAVIRVSSAMPVEEDFLTFLIQLDSGGGRMVREYSVALAAEDSLAAPVPPPVQSAVAAPSDQIVRVPDAAAVGLLVEEVAPVPLAGSAASPPAVAPIPLAAAAPKRTDGVPPRASKAAAKSAARPAPMPAATPAPKPTPAADPVPVARTAPAPSKPAPAAIPPATPATAESIPVEAGDTLTAIASRLDRSDHTLDQMMLALLRANPDAFARGNINLLRRGVVLRMPPAEALSRYDAARAAAVVAEQTRQWRDGEMPAMHPAVLADEAPQPATRTMPAEAPWVAPPRLEIAPPAAEIVATSFVATQSGIASAGTGRELRPGTSMDAARQVAPAVQVEQMQAHIAELEALQRDQQKLIALQNSALAVRGQTGGWSWAWLAALAAVFASGWALARWRTGKRLARVAASAESQHARPAWHDGGNEEPEPV